MTHCPFAWRVGVGDPNREHSGDYKIWSAKNTKDVYISGRGFGGKMKVSLHASGSRHVGLTKSAAAQEINDRSSGQKSRHFDTWFGSFQTQIGCSIEYILRFPTPHLRRFETTRKNPTKWLSPAPENQCLDLLVAFADKDTEVTINRPLEIVEQGVLVDGTRVFLFQRFVDFTALNNFDELRSDILSKTNGMNITKDPSMRVTVGFKVDDIRGWADYAADTFFREK